MSEERPTAGVVGVGSMGQHHARVYNELPGVDFGGVADADADRAADVATKYGTDAMDQTDLLERCDAVSIAVPTRYHYGVATEAIDRGVNVLVEKPFVSDLARGRELVEMARERDVALQVGHVERFNPAVRALSEIVADLDVIAVDVQRLGPPVDRDSKDGVVLDLMIHDIDVVLSTIGSTVERVSAMGTRDRNHVTAQLELADGVVADLTASRVTQEKVRRLAITAEECRVNVDYEAQSVQIHRHSVPEYYESDGDLRYRHESIIERPTIENGEPLRAELEAFVEAATTGSRPPVTGEDALAALDVARRIDDHATGEPPAIEN
ncbi:oxidoreductase (plasmid) [Halorientalis sp. IM1011]|uniref:Gfo/Idh/MocA family protein n=1 Tax=Halorientalis sp. IM1011 TaxID=1932360 RepID=UPI00097CCF81|nr:Gfo/Idh/MocA family oxidoreductase [Halorientalis sp. IM1011]AQL44917.1 oxidoreductase [Halorientalis sp. IM1011]